jgi:hypothetical protein
MFEQTSRGRVPATSAQAEAVLRGDRNPGTIPDKAPVTMATASTPDHQRAQIEGPMQEIRLKWSAKI